MKGKKLQSIYEYFGDYSKVQVDEMLGRLNEEEMNLIHLRYGDDLENPLTSKSFGKEETTKFYGVLVPKMKRLLNNKEGKKKTSKAKQTVISANNTNIIPKNKAHEKHDDNEAYLKIYELFNMPYFIHALSKIDPRDYRVLFLRLNYPDKSIEEIANFTGISKEKLITSFSNAAEELKDAVDNLINEAFGISDSEIKNYNVIKKDNM